MAEGTINHAMITEEKLHWSGNMLQRFDNHIPKKLLYGEPVSGKENCGRPHKFSMNCLKAQLKLWEELVQDRTTWCWLIYSSIAFSEGKSIAYIELKHQRRKVCLICPV